MHVVARVEYFSLFVIDFKGNTQELTYTIGDPHPISANATVDTMINGEKRLLNIQQACMTPYKGLFLRERGFGGSLLQHSDLTV